MRPGWVPDGIQAQATAHRGLGAEAVRQLGTAGEFATVVRILADSPYARFLPPQPTVAEA